MLRIYALIALLIFPASASDPGLEAPGLAIDLITENRSVTAGESFTVGLHIHHFPGFHTYWKNPGMVGFPSDMAWELPEGFVASEIRWPYPERTHMAEYPCYGYERDITLLVTITPPSVLTGKSATLVAKARWMACSKGCFPGFQDFKLTLPVTTTALPDHTARALIEEARKQLPETDHQAEVTVLSKANEAEIRVRIRHPDLASSPEVHFFSTDRQISTDHPQKFEKQDDGSVILKMPRSEFAPKNPTDLPAVLRIGTKYLAVSAPYSA